jgi:hypothetical protein
MEANGEMGLVFQGDGLRPAGGLSGFGGGGGSC